MMLALLVETWWMASVVLRWGRGVFLMTALVATVEYSNLAHFLGALSLAILCHVGHRATCHFIIETARQCSD